MPKGNYKGNGMLVGRVDRKGDYRAKGTGEMIRDYLAVHGADYVMNIWRAVCAEAEAEGYHTPTYESFRKYFNDLKKLNLVLGIDATVRSSAFGAPLAKLIPDSIYDRMFYSLNPALRNSAMWANPHRYLYSGTGTAIPR